MKMLIRYVKNNIKEKSGRTILIMFNLLIVSIAIATLSLICFGSKIMAEAGSNMADIEYTIKTATTESISNKAFQELEKDFDILKIATPMCGYIKKDDVYNPVTLEGLDVNKTIDFNLLSIKDEDNISLEKNEAIITSDISKKYNLKEGIEFEYYGRNGNINILKVKYIVKSILLDQTYKIITTEETLAEISGDKNAYYMALGKCLNNNVEEKILNAESTLGVDFITNNEVINIKDILRIAVVIIILILTIIFVSLKSIIKIIINERMADIGTFRSIGVTKKQIILMLIGEFSIYSIMPAILGGVIGCTILKTFESFLNSCLTYIGSSIEINSAQYIIPISLITIVCTLLFQTLLAISELVKIYKMSIKDIIFSKHVNIYKYSIIKFLIGIFLLIIGVISIIKYNQLNYWYCVISILSILISMALLVPVISLMLNKLFKKVENPIIIMAINKIKNNSLQINTNIIFTITISISLAAYSVFNYTMDVKNSKLKAVNSDLYVEENYYISGKFDKTDDIYKLDGIKSVSTLYDIKISNQTYTKVKIANKEIKEIHLMYSNNYEKLEKDCNLFNIENNLEQNLAKYQVIVSNYYKEVYNLNIGDKLILLWENEENSFKWQTPINLEIVGFTDLSKLYNNSMIISNKLGEEISTLLFKGYNNIKYFVNLEDNSSENAKKTRKEIINQVGINSNYTTDKVFTNEGYIKAIKENERLASIGMICIVSSLAGIALIGIMNNQTVSFMERRKELATLYSIAMSKKQLKNMILIENIIAFIISSISSIVFYIIILKLIKYTLQVLLIPIDIKFALNGLLIFLLVIVLILLGIQKNMRNHIKGMNIVEEIKYE